MDRENWTPGPWAYTEDDRNGQPQVEDGAQLICLVAHECVKPDHETRANAHLIAASPGMYEALKQAREALWFVERELLAQASIPEVDARDMKRTRFAIDQAMAEARGEEMEECNDGEQSDER